MKTEKQLKAEATKAEKARVYDNMNLPPRDIRIEGWVRKVWQSGREFGWGRWERA